MVMERAVFMLDELSKLKGDDPSGKIAYSLLYYPVTVLGPGKRAGLWVTGCFLECVGCISTDFWEPSGYGSIETASDIATRIAGFDGIEGLTISGGEPMAQARDLSLMVRDLREERPGLDVICYTGFRMEELYSGFDIDDFYSSEDREAYLADRQTDLNRALCAHDLIMQCDVVIDGRYVHGRRTEEGIMGSYNQRAVHITGALTGYDFGAVTRQRQDVLVARPDDGRLQRYEIGLPEVSA